MSSTEYKKGIIDTKVHQQFQRLVPKNTKRKKRKKLYVTPSYYEFPERLFLRQDPLWCIKRCTRNKL